MRPGVFDGEPRLADPAEPVQRAARDRDALGARKRRAQVFERRLAPFEKVAERGERQVARLMGGHRRRFHQCVNHRRAENLRNEVVGALERRTGIAVDRLQTIEMLGLRRARGLGWVEFRAASECLPPVATIRRSLPNPTASHASHCV